jgi:hypothetical protein
MIDTSPTRLPPIFVRSAAASRIGSNNSWYCETDRFSNAGCSSFGQIPKGSLLVSAICDRITFSYQRTSQTKQPGMPVPSDAAFAETSPTSLPQMCRCMNASARYCAGYLANIGMPPDDVPRGLRSQETGPSFGSALTALDNVSRCGHMLTDGFINVA